MQIVISFTMLGFVMQSRYSHMVLTWFKVHFSCNLMLVHTKCVCHIHYHMLENVGILPLVTRYSNARKCSPYLSYIIQVLPNSVLLIQTLWNKPSKAIWYCLQNVRTNFSFAQLLLLVNQIIMSKDISSSTRHIYSTHEFFVC